MTDAGAIGAIILYLFFAIVGFLIAVLIMRAIFRINKIVDLLTSIDARLQGQAAAAQLAGSPDTGRSVTTGGQAPGPAATAPNPFRMAISELSVGDKLETPDGRHYILIDFRRVGLQVKNDQGKRETLPPSNFAFSRTKWTFEVRKMR